MSQGFDYGKSPILCVGLDVSLDKLPMALRRSPYPIQEFNRKIISATSEYAGSYKINVAFYEQYGESGLKAMRDSLAFVSPKKMRIADAKRGDIGNTSSAYARAIFDDAGFDAATVSPYMGSDSVKPFLEWEDKTIFILALTSNPGSADFQRLQCNGKSLYLHVVETSLRWSTIPRQIGFVVGATHPEELAEIRRLAPDAPLLIPGIGTQGGDVSAIVEANGGGPAIINISRDIIYASSSADFAEAAKNRAQYYYSKITG